VSLKIQILILSGYSGSVICNKENIVLSAENAAIMTPINTVATFRNGELMCNIISDKLPNFWIIDIIRCAVDIPRTYSAGKSGLTQSLIEFHIHRADDFSESRLDSGISHSTITYSELSELSFNDTSLEISIPIELKWANINFDEFKSILLTYYKDVLKAKMNNGLIDNVYNTPLFGIINSSNNIKYTENTEIVKYCKSIHNPLNGCRTLQLGTAEYYRAMDESNSIADNQEGFINLVVNNPSMIGAIVQGNLGDNVYIFSMSTIDMPLIEAKSRFSSDYDSRYYIKDIKDIKELRDLLGNQLLSQLTLDDFSEYSRQEIEENGGLNKVYWICHAHPITYSMTLVMNGASLNVFDYDIWVESNFRKREHYQGDSEFRFLYVLFINGMILSPVTKPKILEFPENTVWKCLSLTKTVTP